MDDSIGLVGQEIDNKQVAEQIRLGGMAAGYPVYERYLTNKSIGDAADWLTIQGITSITIELERYEILDFESNLSGMLAALDYQT